MLYKTVELYARSTMQGVWSVIIPHSAICICLEVVWVAVFSFNIVVVSSWFKQNTYSKFLSSQEFITYLWVSVHDWHGALYFKDVHPLCLAQCPTYSIWGCTTCWILSTSSYHISASELQFWSIVYLTGCFLFLKIFEGAWCHSQKTWQLTGWTTILKSWQVNNNS